MVHSFILQQTLFDLYSSWTGPNSLCGATDANFTEGDSNSLQGPHKHRKGSMTHGGVRWLKTKIRVKIRS